MFLAHLLNALLMIAMPLGLAIFLNARWKFGARLWLIGAVGQRGVQPFIQLVMSQSFSAHHPQKGQQTIPQFHDYG